MFPHGEHGLEVVQKGNVSVLVVKGRLCLGEQRKHLSTSARKEE